MERKLVIAGCDAGPRLLSSDSATLGTCRNLWLWKGLRSCVASAKRASVRVASNGSGVGSAIAVALVIMATGVLTACGTPPAKDFSGSWHPINRFQSQPTEIPLEQAYTFYAAPMDETLKTMLGRWARDTGRTLNYSLAYDVTLYKPVAEIRTPDLDSAVQQLNKIFAKQGVLVVGHPREIVVQAVQGQQAESAVTGKKESVGP